MTTHHDDLESLDDEQLLDVIYDLRHDLTEAQSEIRRHHDDFEQVSKLAEQAHNALKSFDGDDPGLWVGDATTKVRSIRNIVG